MYTERELVRLAKRENNKKRKYLVVNRLQGKHIPVVPSDAFSMFTGLSEIVKNQYPKEKLLLVGFAETATAIGAAVAVDLDCFYMQTTREVVAEAEYLYFCESHSHAKEQKLVKNDIDELIKIIDCIVFIEDEITTGNTIMNIIEVMKREYPEYADRIRFSVASILNGMNAESEEIYRSHHIPVHYLVKTEHDKYDSAVDNFAGNGEYIGNDSFDSHSADLEYTELTAYGYANARRLVEGKAYEAACQRLWNQIDESIDFAPYDRILVLGTEEFMYPALYTAAKLEKRNKHVLFHATTRSPIVVSREENYPLHARYQLTSFYDSQRTTFLYDLDKYDYVLLITDAQAAEKAGIDSIVSALAQKENRDICVIKWQLDNNS